MLPKNFAQPAPNSVARDGYSLSPPDCERDARAVQFWIQRERNPQRVAFETATAAQRYEVGPAAARIDQALSRCRPLRRRAFTTARPARVDIR